MKFDDEVRASIRKSLGLPEKQSTEKSLKEAYVAEPKKFQLKTEFLSAKTKKARLNEFQKYVKSRLGPLFPPKISKRKATNKKSYFWLKKGQKKEH